MNTEIMPSPSFACGENYLTGTDLKSLQVKSSTLSQVVQINRSLSAQHKQQFLELKAPPRFGLGPNVCTPVIYECFQKLECLSLASISQPKLKFASKTGAYPSEAHFWCSTIGQAPALTHKQQTRLKGLPRTNAVAFYKCTKRLLVNFQSTLLLIIIYKCKNYLQIHLLLIQT